MELLFALCGAGFVTLWFLIRRDDGGWLEEITCDEVIVHTKDKDSIQGALTQVTRHELVLSRASFLEGERQLKLDGEVGIARTNVSFVQRIVLTRDPS